MAKLSLGMSEDPSDQAALGLQMLKSGKVSPQEVQAAQIAMKDPGGTQDWLSKYLGKSTVDPYTLKSTGSATPPAAQLPPDDTPEIPTVAAMKALAPKGALPKGTQTKQDAKMSSDKKNSVTQNTFQSADQFNENADKIRATPEYQDQAKGANDMDTMIDAMKNRAPVNNQDWFVKPFLGLTDAQTGSNFSKNFTPSETQADRNAKLLQAQEDAQKKKAELTKTLLEGITKLKSGSETNSTNQALTQSNAFMQGMLGGRMGLGDPDDRMAFQAHQATLRAVKNDKTLRDRLGQFSNLDNAMALVLKSKHITPQQIDEFQGTVRSNLGIKGTGGVEERDRTRLNSLGFNADRINQLLTGDPASISKDNAMLQHIQDLALNEQENVRDQYGKQLAAVSGGNDWLYNDPRYAKYKNSLDSLIGAKKATMTSAIDPAITSKLKSQVGKTPAGGAQAKPKTVVQNGHTFTLNEATGEYE